MEDTSTSQETNTPAVKEKVKFCVYFFDFIFTSRLSLGV